MSRLERFEADQRAWLAQQFQSVPDEFVVLKPSTWAESRRYLPPQTTPMPGYYSFDVAPYLKEIVDCLSVDSPIREVTVMKGVQIGATVGVLENAIGYAIEHVRTAPVMLVTADRNLAKTRVNSYIIPMLEHSNLLHLIKSADEGNKRKSGKTEQKIEWEGGGYLIPLGAQNANKLRSLSIEWLLLDEIDAWPLVVGRDGDPLKLVRDRTVAYEASRKIFEISSPTVLGQSKTAESFARGDRRFYFVCCLECGFSQVLRWKHTNNETGQIGGIVWEMRDGKLVPDSVRYACQSCGHEHQNDDKTRLLSPDNGAEWRPTAEPTVAHHRSYHISALYSPVGMQTWTACVEKWLEAWDIENDRARDLGKLQVFYNNVLGEPFELRGERVKLAAVSGHRRAAYRFGQVPNKYAVEHCGSPILLLTCAVDVHGDCLPTAVMGWCRDRRPFLIDYWRLEGDTDQIDDQGSWGALRELITNKRYLSDDVKEYPIALTLIDSGFRTDKVYEFAAEFSGGVYAVKGRDIPPQGAAVREFSEFQTPLGPPGYLLTVDLYKDRWSSSLRREWHGQGLQPVGCFNAPSDVTEKQLKELTAETKLPKPGRHGGFEWRRPSGAANELWDLLVYNNAALDLIAWDASGRGKEPVDWPAFWDFCQQKQRDGGMPFFFPTT